MSKGQQLGGGSGKELGEWNRRSERHNSITQIHISSHGRGFGFVDNNGKGNDVGRTMDEGGRQHVKGKVHMPNLFPRAD